MFRKNKVIAPGSIKISQEYYRVPYLMIKIKLEAIWQKISLPKSLLNGHLLSLSSLGLSRANGHY